MWPGFTSGTRLRLSSRTPLPLGGCLECTSLAVFTCLQDASVSQVLEDSLSLRKAQSLCYSGPQILAVWLREVAHSLGT